MKPLVLVDGHGLAFRAFYALPPLSAPDGTPTNAILGFLNMWQRLEERMGGPDWLFFFDPKGPTHRHEIYPDYKKGRRPTPEEFKAQVPILIELLEAMGMPISVREGIEADDGIAATALSASEAGREVRILSADKDLLQILRPRVVAFRPVRGVSEFEEWDHLRFREERGFPPERIVDYLALTGDVADHIPGVAGIGEKTAGSLIAEWGSLEDLYGNLASLSPGVRGKLERGREAAFRSRDLIRALPVDPFPLEGLVRRPVKEEALGALLDRLALRKLSDRLLGGRSPARAPVERGEAEDPPDGSLLPGPLPLENPGERSEREGAGGRVEVSASFEAGAVPREVSVEEVLCRPRIAVLPVGEKETSRLCLCAEDGAVATVPPSEALLDALASGRDLLLWDYRDWLIRTGRELEPSRLFAVSTAHYLLHPDLPAHGPEAFLDPARAEAPEGLFEAERRLRSDPLWPDVASLAPRIDLPLIPLLLEMERRGIGVDRAALERLDAELEGDVRRLERAVAEEAGVEINLNSPKQVGELLYDRLGLPSLRKTRVNRAPSTDARSLQELARLPDPQGRIPRLLVEHRETAKLRSAFVRPFLALTGEEPRIRSTFDAAATGTGRLASRDPNVQNLPVFGPGASRFRACLVPAPGFRFVAADYSQIELRVLACLSGERRLIEIFERGEDVHARTASWIFGISPDEVVPEQRRFAKVVNFGLIYGMGVHGLAERMGTDRGTAKRLIDRYFGVLPGVREYLERSVAEARARGYARSPLGRIRPLGEVSTVEGRGPGAIERVAVNSPIQSAAADLTKIAMLRLREPLRRAIPEAGLVLQVHDSLVIECPEERSDEAERLLVGVMEAVDVLPLTLRAEPKRGESLAAI